MSFLKMSLFFFFAYNLIACSQADRGQKLDPKTQESQLYSDRGREFHVQFNAIYRSDYEQVGDVQARPFNRIISRTTQFLFGPLTYRSIGGVQKGEKITAHTEKAYLQNGRVMIPYSYEATWMLNNQKLLQLPLEIPLPYSASDLGHTNWLNCTDKSDPEHSTLSFLWYFWDPSRPSCKQQLNVDFQMVSVKLDEETKQTVETYPEYNHLIHLKNGVQTLGMTFAFGYVEEVSNPKPFQDSDFGMREFQKFYQEVKSTLLTRGFKETSIQQNDISKGTKVIGALFTGNQFGVVINVSVIAAAGVDQMDIFANSFALKHDGFFGWFGHSRVGDGFDADNFKYILRMNPERFSISPDYQLVYWAGCNSYSYYTLPFFDLKTQLDPAGDPQGTRHLDIISNTLPSLFAFNAANASILFKALVNYPQPTSYQTLIQQVENLANRSGYDVIVNVLGDEDNQTL